MTQLSSNSGGGKRIYAKKSGLTIRSTGRYTACRHLGYKSLAQIPATCSAPVSSNVSHQPKYVRAIRGTSQRIRGVRCHLREVLAVARFRIQRHERSANGASSSQQKYKGCVLLVLKHPTCNRLGGLPVLWRSAHVLSASDGTRARQDSRSVED